MEHNVRSEFELYEPMRLWLERHLADTYKGAEIIAVDAHARTLDLFLEAYGVIERYPQVVGLDIQIDVLGIVKQHRSVSLAFIEAKKTPLTLRDLGQLWAYCRLCDPAEAFLLSSAGVGSLNKILVNFAREDLLDFGQGKQIKKMQVGKWDLHTNAIDYKTLLPKL